MKSVKISKDNKLLLKKDGKSYDDVLTDLISKTEAYMPVVGFNDYTTSPIKISEENYEKLEALAISHSEPVNNIITRMFIVLQQLEQ